MGDGGEKPMRWWQYATLAGLVGGAVAAGVWWNNRQSKPGGLEDAVQEASENKPAAENKPAVEEPAYYPDEPLPNDSNSNVSIGLLTTDNGSKLTGIQLDFNPEFRDYLAQFAPVHYEIHEFGVSFRLPVEDGLKGARTTFREPRELERAILRIYGVDPRTGKERELFNTPLPYDENNQ